MRFPLFRLAHVGIDTLLCITVYCVVFLLRFEGHIPPGDLHGFWLGLPIITAARLIANYTMGIYSHLWKYTGVHELFSMIKATLLGSVLFVLSSFLMGLSGFPRSIFVFEGAFFLLAASGVRYSRRFSNEVSLANKSQGARRTLIIGAGDAGTMVAGEMLRHRENGYIPVGFIDDNPQKWRARIHNLRVYGGRERLLEVVESREIEALVIAIPSAPRQVIRDLVQICQPLNIPLQIVPATHQILSGEVHIEQLRRIQIEDLLGRDPIRLDDTLVNSHLKGKRVLVTGAGGSIGSELCRQILTYQPEVLYLLGHGENSIYKIQQELADKRVQAVIMDIRDQPQLDQFFAQHRPQQVFHAAAHKHVPLMEDNLTEAFLNNVWGSYCVLKSAIKHQAEHAVLISTDKAAEPLSIMGLSKYFAEQTARYLSHSTPKTRLAVVRFGNVIGSRGSVIPLFEQQIAAGGPLTVTHPEMTRYFMTIPEAVQLVLQAAVLPQNLGTYVLEMGEPVLILDMAQNMCRLSGQDDLAIRFTGMRPGEKLHERLHWSDETLIPTLCPQIMEAQSNARRILDHQNLLKKMLAILEHNPHQFAHFFQHTLQQHFAISATKKAPPEAELSMTLKKAGLD